MKSGGVIDENQSAALFITMDLWDAGGCAIGSSTMFCYWQAAAVLEAAIELNAAEPALLKKTLCEGVSAHHVNSILVAPITNENAHVGSAVHRR